MGGSHWDSHLLVALFVLCSGKAGGFNDMGMDGRVRFL